VSTLWRPGEHVAIVGQTGSGKTHLIDRLLRENRTYVVVLKTKWDPEDFDPKTAKYWKGYKRIETVRGMDDTRHTRFLLAPPLGKYPHQYDAQIREAHRLVDKVFSQGGWTVVFDERFYAEHKLGLQEGIELLETQGRGKSISVVSAMQRPVEVSRFALSQASHVFSFVGDARDGDTLGRATMKPFGQAVVLLTGHDFAYYHKPTRRITTGNSRGLGAVLAPVLAAADATAGAAAATMRSVGGADGR